MSIRDKSSPHTVLYERVQTWLQGSTWLVARGVQQLVLLDINETH